MRKLIGLGAAWICAGLAGGMGACSGDDNSGAVGDDASSDQAVAQVDTSVPDVGPTPGLDAQAHVCSLSAASGGTDPVLLCSQETALLYLVQYAYKTGVGVAAGFSSQAPTYAAIAEPDSASALADDLGLSTALGAFHCSAQYYGDNAYSSTLDGALGDLAKIVPGQVKNVASGYDGTLYFRMRSSALAFYEVMNPTAAAAMNAAADAYARNILSSFVHQVPAPPATQPPPPDAGSDAASSDGAAPSEAGTPDEAGSVEAGPLPVDAGAPPVAVIGTLNAQDGTVSYDAPRAFSAAAALFDMASREASTKDAGAEVAAMQSAAVSALAYLWQRAQDPSTGLFYQALVTSQDPSHDALSTDTTQFKYASDALLTEAQSAIVMALARAQYAAASAFASDGGTEGGTGFTPQYGTQLETLVTSMTNAKLFNGQTIAPTGATTPPPPGAWLEGLVPSLGQTLTNQPTASSALMLGGYVRARPLGVPVVWSWEVAGIRQALSFSPPNGGQWTANKSMTSVVTDHLGDVVQLSYLPAASRGWSWAQAFSPTGADAGVDPAAQNYSTAAVSQVVEGLSQYWYQQPGMSPCVF